jgi:hypothetical protein
MVKAFGKWVIKEKIVEKISIPEFLNTNHRSQPIPAT